MKENNTIKRIALDGTMTVLAEYDGKFSAEYALYLWWCQQHRHCDYNNLCNWYKFQEESKVLRHSAMIEDGMDVINICGVEFYALQLERMMEKGYKYLLRYRDVIQIEYVTNYEGHWLGRVIYKTQSNITQRGRYYAATAAMVNRHLGFKLLNEEDAK